MVQKTRTAGPAAGVDCECGGESPAAMDVDKLAARIIYIAGAAADLFGVLSMERMQLPSAASTETAHGVAFHQVQKILFCDATQIHSRQQQYTPCFNRQRHRPAAAVGRSRTLGFLIHFQGRNPTDKDGRNNDSDADRSRPDAFILSIRLQL